MSTITWGDLGSRIYEQGVDRGVFYLPGRMGVPWNGLVSVAENPEGAEARAYYLDGYKYHQMLTAEEFAATIEAYYSPQDFGLVEGNATISNGLIATGQPRQKFNFSYRSGMGSDVSSEHGYKIHLVYNALSSKSSRTHKTKSTSTSPDTLSWDITSKPEKIPGMRPTAHLIVDSTQTSAYHLAILEGYLYGAEGIDPFMPTIAQLITLFES